MHALWVECTPDEKTGIIILREGFWIHMQVPLYLLVLNR